jgi:hypothetical protein
MSQKPFAETSWAHCGKILGRRISKTSVVDKDDLFCMEVLVDATHDKKCPEGKDTIRRIALTLFYPYDLPCPVSVEDLKEKFYVISGMNHCVIKEFRGTLAIIAEGYVAFKAYENILSDVDEIWEFSEHLKKPFTQVS